MDLGRPSHVAGLLVQERVRVGCGGEQVRVGCGGDELGRMVGEFARRIFGGKGRPAAETGGRHQWTGGGEGDARDALDGGGAGFDCVPRIAASVGDDGGVKCIGVGCEQRQAQVAEKWEAWADHAPDANGCGGEANAEHGTRAGAKRDAVELGDAETGSSEDIRDGLRQSVSGFAFDGGVERRRKSGAGQCCRGGMIPQPQCGIRAGRTGVHQEKDRLGGEELAEARHGGSFAARESAAARASAQNVRMNQALTGLCADA